MNLCDLRFRIADIRDAVESDPGDQCHILQDDLLWDFVEYLSSRKDLVGEKAKLLLDVRDMEFDRFYC